MHFYGLMNSYYNNNLKNKLYNCVAYITTQKCIIWQCNAIQSFEDWGLRPGLSCSTKFQDALCFKHLETTNGDPGKAL